MLLKDSCHICGTFQNDRGKETSASKNCKGFAGQFNAKLAYNVEGIWSAIDPASNFHFRIHIKVSLSSQSNLSSKKASASIEHPAAETVQTDSVLLQMEFTSPLRT